MKEVTARLVTAVETLARSDRRLAATVDQWDADVWLFNTPAGTVELQTGLIREHRRLDYITKLAGAGPSDTCRIPIFLSFLDTIFAKDEE